MVGKTAKRDGVFPVLVPRCQCDIKNTRCGNGVLEEHLIEVAHPEKNDTVGVASFDFQILPHGWRQVVHSH